MVLNFLTLPGNLNNSLNINIFKKHLKNHLIGNAFYSLKEALGESNGQQIIY